MPTAASARSNSSPVSGLTQGLASGIRSAVSSALSGDWQRVLKNALGGFTRSLGSLVSRRAGGGMMGGLFGSLVSGGLSMLVGKLFQKKQRVSVAGTVHTEVLNFPRLSNLNLATNPASRLLGGRAEMRGPAFSVTVDYRDGAEDVVSAKVATKLCQLNAMQGIT